MNLPEDVHMWSEIMERPDGGLDSVLQLPQNLKIA